MINLIVHNQNKILKIYKEYEATKPSEIINVKDRTKVECYLQFIEELSERTNTQETSDKHETEQLNILGVVRSLPSDDEIEKVADEKIFISSVKRKYSSIYSEGFEDGAKWIKQKIVNS